MTAESTSFLIESRSPPTESSMRVSAPARSAAMAFLTSASTSTISDEVPILAFTLVLRPMPMPTRAEARLLFKGMTHLPSAIF